MLKFTDNSLLVIWNIIKYILILAFKFLRVVILIIKNLLTPLFKLPYLRGIAKFAEGIADSRMADAVKESSSNFCTMFSEKMEESKNFRRVIFPIWTVMLVLYLYPPSHWGPWYKYQTGTSSYYSSGFWFKKTANGDTFIPLFYTAAHKTLPLGITAKVVNCENGKTVYVKINDRGPFVKGRILDLSSGAAKKIGIYKKGTGKVTIYTKKRYN
jgi:rare lipoprotein A (peptidoglycan hydrolase)